MSSSGQPAPGIVFGLSRDGFFAMVEHLDRDAGGSLSLSVMPGEDAMLTANGDVAEACARGNFGAIDELFLEGAFS